MAKILIEIDTDRKESRKCDCVNEDFYLERVVDALSALQLGRLKEAEAALQDLLTDVETVLAGGEI